MSDSVPTVSGLIPQEFQRKEKRKPGDFRKDAQIRRNSGEPYKTKSHFVPGKNAPSQVSS